jgi:hypothetical protein
MNRAVLSLALWLVMLPSLRQGTIHLANPYIIQTLSIDAPFYDALGISIAGSEYAAQLYAWKPDEGFLAVGRSTPFQTNGYFESIGVTIWFVGSFTPALEQVRAWHLPGGATFEEAVAAGTWTGVSETLVVPEPGFGGGFPPSLPALLIGLRYPGVPLIVDQPQSQITQPGQQVTLSVLASSGVGLKYQWYQMPSDTPNNPDGLIYGATNAVYVTGALQTNTRFWVTLSNSAGAVISAPAQVTVVSNPPRLRLSMVSGQPNLAVDGVPGTPYRIEHIPDLNGSDWSPLVEVTLQSSPLTLIDATTSNSFPRFYRVALAEEYALVGSGRRSDAAPQQRGMLAKTTVVNSGPTLLLLIMLLLLIPAAEQEQEQEQELGVSSLMAAQR